MNLHADLEQAARTEYAQSEWLASPQTGVNRLMLERIGGEMASRASTIVSYAPGSSFPEHTHGGGEEFFVLEGTFSDESGDFDEGFYVRNPVGSRHAPKSDPGTTIFVKLGQIDAGDQASVRIDTRNASWQTGPDSGPDAGPDAGLSALPLHRFGAEEVRLVKLAPGTRVPLQTAIGGAEVFVINGQLKACGHQLGPRDWLRVPAGDHLQFESRDGCVIYLKTGHLPAARERAAEFCGPHLTARIDQIRMFNG